MPYLQLDTAGPLDPAVKQEIMTRLCRLYAEIMQTQSWRPNVAIRELGPGNIARLGADGLEPVAMVLAEIRRGRSTDDRLALARGIAATCAPLLRLPPERVLVEFTVHAGDEMYREGQWVGEWTASEGRAA